MIEKKLRSIIGQISILIFCLFQTVFAQNLVQQAQKDLEWLCSDSLAGRGFEKKGMQNAALWLSSEYAKAGLNPLDDSFLQDFSVEVNLSERINVSFGDQEWKAGEDFLIHASSNGGGIFANLQIIELNGTKQDWIKKVEKIKDKDHKFVAIVPNKNPKKKNLEILDFKAHVQLVKDYKVAGIIFVREKLTHTYSETRENVRILECKESKWLNLKEKRISGAWNCSIQKNTCSNVIAVSPKENAVYPDSFVIFCAHYDHLGMMGNSIFRGANDNASGTAFLLALARKLPNLKTKYRIILISFAAEEAGLKGSLHFVKNPLVDLTKVKYVLNFDLMGNGQNGVMAVGAETFPELYSTVMAAKPQNGQMKDLAKRPNAANSDHYPFTLRNIPALFFYTMGGPPHYHDVNDEAKGLEFTIFEEFHQWMLNLIQNP